MDTTIIIDELKGESPPDGSIMTRAVEMVAQTGTHKIGNMLLFAAIRLLIKRGVVSKDKIAFYYNNNKLEVDEKGDVKNWPANMFSMLDNILSELLDC